VAIDTGIDLSDSRVGVSVAVRLPSAAATSRARHDIDTAWIGQVLDCDTSITQRARNQRGAVVKRLRG
jgi:hypothetical protein